MPEKSFFSTRIRVNFWLTRSFQNTVRSILQDSGNLLARFLHAVYRPLHVLYLRVQHPHEDLLHFSNCTYYLPDAIQKAILHDLWCARRPVPSFENIVASRSSFDCYLPLRTKLVGINLELFTLARIARIYPIDHNALKNSHYRKLDESICSYARHVQILLHHQLVRIQ